MIEEIDRLDQLVLDMLELSHLESGSQPMEMAPFSLNQLLDRCERQFSEPFRNSHIGLRLVAPGDECTVWGDMGSIEHRLTAGETKTGAGKRIITLPPSMAQLLSERRKRSYTEWIFPDPLRPERPTRPNAAYVRMKELLKKAGLPSIRFHDLRHTFATHALASGVDAKTLSGILGHTQASFTLDTYTHVTGDMQKRASEIVGGFMENIMVR